MPARLSIHGLGGRFGVGLAFAQDRRPAPARPRVAGRVETAGQPRPRHRARRRVGPVDGHADGRPGRLAGADSRGAGAVPGPAGRLRVGADGRRAARAGGPGVVGERVGPGIGALAAHPLADRGGVRERRSVDSGVGRILPASRSIVWRSSPTGAWPARWSSRRSSARGTPARRCASHLFRVVAYLPGGAAPGAERPDDRRGLRRERAASRWFT